MEKDLCYVDCFGDKDLAFHIAFLVLTLRKGVEFVEVNEEVDDYGDVGYVIRAKCERCDVYNIPWDIHNFVLGIKSGLEYKERSYRNERREIKKMVSLLNEDGGEENRLYRRDLIARNK